jgi:hypothetical protein
LGRNQAKAKRRWQQRKARPARHPRNFAHTALVVLGLVLVLCFTLFAFGVRVRVSRELVAIQGVLHNMIYDGVSAEEFKLACQRNPRVIHETDPDMGRPIDLALKLERIDLVEILLEMGVDPNERIKGMEYTDDTLLILAIHLENVDAVRLLLDHGADPDLADADGRNAREHAAERDNAAIRALLEK